jgi:ribosomal protein S18 acetylase RimI-like enzyme
MLQRLDVAATTAEVTPAAALAPDGRFFGPDCIPADVLVAEVDGVLAGWVRLGTKYRELASARHVLELKGLAVDPSLRRRGVGRLLLDAAVAAARARGARRLTLRVLGSNAPARSLYEAGGFGVEGVQREEFLLGGRYVDDVLMALDLTEA